MGSGEDCDLIVLGKTASETVIAGAVERVYAYTKIGGVGFNRLKRISRKYMLSFKHLYLLIQQHCGDLSGVKIHRSPWS